ncbi:TolC family outer membrane protein [uncultured Sphingomonas sp.]|uniref:TolC family outer membrane protein n=1 Tax=uncultured Sphingomonas sp. TaxID=158754 RepID=UPI0025EF7D84|nr:TolC family outer membrane protein [uncultured Sphingomonas sp.]
MVKRGLIWGMMAGTALTAMPASATTLRDAFNQTYTDSPDLNAARAQLQATDEGVPIAKAASRLGVTGVVGVTQSSNGLSRLDNGARVLTGQVNLNYPLFQGGRVRNAINAAEARVVAGRSDLRTVEGNTFTEAVGTYMDVIRDQAIVDLRKKNVDVLNTNVRASRDRFEVGDLTRTDVAQSEARLSLARSQLATAQGNLTSSRENYRRVIGSWPERLEQPPALPVLPATSDQAVDIALKSSPAIATATATTQAAQYDVRATRAQRLPTLSAIGGSSYNDYLGTRARQVGLPNNTPGIDQTQGQNNLGVSLSVPLYQGGLVGARVRQAQAIENQALEQSISIERLVVSRVRGAFAVYQAAGAAITANQQAVSANTLALEGVRAENSVGTRTVIEVLNAEQELLNAQVSLVSAQRDQYVAGFALLNAMGHAEARDLGLDGGALYDPLSNYDRVRNRFGDWSDNRRYTSRSTRTTGQTPDNADVQPYTPGESRPVTPPRN